MEEQMWRKHLIEVWKGNLGGGGEKKKENQVKEHLYSCSVICVHHTQVDKYGNVFKVSPFLLLLA